MFGRIFPRQFDNVYRGHWLGLVIFAIVVLLRGVQGFNCMVMPHTVITGADAIPIDTFGAAAAQTTVGLFAMLGIMLAVLSLIGLVALVRYRSMIPFLFLTFLVVQIAGRILLLVYPLTREVNASNGYAGHPIGWWFNLGLLAITAIGLLLSSTDGKKAGIVAQSAAR